MHSLITATYLAAITWFARATSKGKNAALFLFFIAVLLAGGTAAVRGQSALDGFDPNADGAIRAVIVQNFYIRARGYYRSGIQNGSESITESVRNAFLAGPAPTPTPPPTPTPTPTPTPPNTVSISGTVTYCTNPALNPAPGVTMTLSGNSEGSTLTDGSGNYSFAGLALGGSYTVTPSKGAVTSASAVINTVDVIAAQRHFIHIGPPITTCEAAAGDVNGVGGVNTVDVIAIQRFFLGLSTGIANTGKHQFIPASTTYTGIAGNQTAQNYDALVLGDVAAPFVHRWESGNDE